jgi:hypothetical protein
VRSSGSSEFPYTPLLLLLQHLARGTADVSRSREEMICAWEVVANEDAAHASTFCVAEASSWDTATVRERTIVFAREKEARAALVESEARERVSRMEAESLTMLTSTHGEAEVFTRRISLLEGELTEACQARDTAEVNSQSLSDIAADTERWWEESERECHKWV